VRHPLQADAGEAGGDAMEGQDLVPDQGQRRQDPDSGEPDKKMQGSAAGSHPAGEPKPNL